MFESILASILNRVLGKYIDNLEYNQLKLGIWNGDVALNNLKLKKDALDDLELPIEIVEGYLGEFTMKIPWQALKTQAVQVNIQKLYILVVPKIEVKFDEVAEKEKAYKRKMEKLASAELFSTSSEIYQDDSKSQSFFDQLVTKIIDNLQFNIEQIHIRYEDKISNPAFPFSIGFTLRSVSAVSTDSQWLETFVHESMDSVHKLLQLNGLAIYQNTRNNFTSFTRDVGRDYISSFEFLIPNDTPQISCGNDNNFAQFATAKDHQYLLEPVSGHGKLIVHKTIKSLVKKYSKPTNFIETFENIVAKHSLHVDFDKLGFSLDMEQYQELLKMIKMFHRFHQMKKYRGFRPEVSCEVDPKAWFQYAIRSALLDIEEINEKWTWKFISEHIRKKKIYEDLHTIRMRPSILAGLSNSPFQQLTTEQKTQLEALERDLEYEDLAFFRLNVLKKLEVEAKELSSLQPGSGTASETPAVMNWFSTMWNWGRPQEKPQVVTKTPDIFLGENNLSLGNEDVRLNRDDMDRLLETIDYHEDSESLLDSTTLQSSTENLMSPSGFFASTLLASSKSPTQRSITYYITKHLSCHVKRASFKLKRKTELLLNVLLDSIRFGFMEQRQLAPAGSKNIIEEHVQKKTRISSSFFLKVKSLSIDEKICRTSSFEKLASSLEPLSIALGSNLDLVSGVHVIYPFYDSALSFHTELYMEPISIVLNNKIHENVMSFFNESPSTFAEEVTEKTQIFERAVAARLENLKNFTSAHLQYLLDRREKSFIQIKLSAPLVYIPLLVKASMRDPMFVVNLGVFEMVTTSKDQSLSGMEDLFKGEAGDFIIDLPSTTYLSKAMAEEAYEAYDCTITDFSVQFYPVASTYFLLRSTSKSLESMQYSREFAQVIESCTLQVLVKLCIVSNDITLPQMKVFIKATRPLQVHLCDLSYQTLMLLMDVFLPTTETDLSSILNRAIKESKEIFHVEKGIKKMDIIKPSDIVEEENDLDDEDEYFDAESDVTLDLDTSTVIHIQSPSGCGLDDLITESVSDLKEGKELELLSSHFPLELAISRSPSPFDDMSALKKLTERRRMHCFVDIEKISIKLYQSCVLMNEVQMEHTDSSDYSSKEATDDFSKEVRVEVAHIEFQEFNLCAVKRDLDMTLLLQVLGMAISLSPALESSTKGSQHCKDFIFYNPFFKATNQNLPVLSDILENCSTNFPLCQSHCGGGGENVFRIKLVKCLPIHPSFESQFEGLQYKVDIRLSEIAMSIQPDIFTLFFHYIQKSFALESQFIASYRQVLLSAPLPWMPLIGEETYHVEITFTIQKVAVFLLKNQRAVIGKMSIGNGKVVAWNAYQNNTEQDKKLITAQIGKLTVDTFTLHSNENSVAVNESSSGSSGSATSSTTSSLASSVITSDKLLYFVEEDSSAIQLSIESFTREQFMEAYQKLGLEEGPTTALLHSLLKINAASLLIYFHPWNLKWIIDWLNNILIGMDAVYKDLCPALVDSVDVHSNSSNINDGSTRIEGESVQTEILYCSHFQVEMETPVMLFSRTEHESSKNTCLVFHLGKMSVKNRFSSDFYYIDMGLDYLAMFAIDVEDMLNYHPIYSRKESLLDPSQLQVSFKIANKIPTGNERLAMTEAVVEFKNTRTVAALDSNRLYLFFERFFWALTQFTLLTAVSEIPPVVMESNAHAFELVLKMPLGLSILVLTNQGKPHCQVTLNNLMICFITNGDYSTQLIVDADSLSIKSPQGEELVTPIFQGNASKEKQLSLVFDMHPNWDSFLKVVLVDFYISLDIVVFMGLYQFYMEGFPGPTDTPELTLSAPTNATNWISIRVNGLKGFIKVADDVQLVLALEKVDFGSKYGHNQLIQVEGISISLIMSEKSIENNGTSIEDFALDLLDPCNLYLTTSYESFGSSKTSVGTGASTNLSASATNNTTRTEIYLSSVLAKFSYQDIVMLQKVISTLQSELLEVPTFTREKPILILMETPGTSGTSFEMTFTCPSLRLLLIDDASAVYIPIFDIYLKEIFASIFSNEPYDNITTTIRKMANFQTNLLVNYMNMNNSMWEPLLEPWQFKIDYEERIVVLDSSTSSPKRSTSDSRQQLSEIARKSSFDDSGNTKELATSIKLTSESRANFNVTKNFLNYFSHIQRVLSESTSEKPNGTNFSRKRMQKEPYRIVNQSGCELRIWKSTTADDPDVQVLKLENGVSLPLSFENWKDTRKGLHPALHSIGIHFLRQDVVHSLVDEEAFLQWESTKVIPVYKEGIQCISHEPRLLEEYEQYAKGTGSTLLVPRHQYIVEVSLERDNEKEIRIKSPLLFENGSMEMTCEIGTLFHGKVVSWVVRPEQRIGIPPLLAYWHTWRIRPVCSGMLYEWSKETFAWKDFTQHPLQELEFSCEPQNSSTTIPTGTDSFTGKNDIDKATFYCHMYATSQMPNTLSKDFPCLVIHFLPPFRLNNLLPFTLYYKMMDKQAKFSLTGKLYPYQISGGNKNGTEEAENSNSWSVDLWTLPSRHLIGIAVHIVYEEKEDEPSGVDLRGSKSKEYILYKSKEVAVVHTGDAARIRKNIGEKNNNILNLSRTLEDLGDENLECLSEETGEIFHLSMAYEFLDWDDRLHSLTGGYPSVEGYWSKGLSVYCPYIVWNQSGLPIQIKQHAMFASSTRSDAGAVIPRDVSGSANLKRDVSVNVNLQRTANVNQTRFVRDQKILMGADPLYSTGSVVDSYDSPFNRALYEDSRVRLPDNTDENWCRLNSKLPRLFSYMSGIMLKNRAMLAVVKSSASGPSPGAISSDWSKAISLEAIGSVQEIILKPSISGVAVGSCGYNLSLAIEPTTFIYPKTGNLILRGGSECKMIRIRVKYCLLNLTSTPLYVRNAFTHQQQSSTLIEPSLLTPFHLDDELGLPKSSKKIPLDQEDWYLAKDYLKGYCLRVGSESDSDEGGLEWSPPLDITQVGTFYFKICGGGGKSQLIKLMKLVVTLKDHQMIATFERINANVDIGPSRVTISSTDLSSHELIDNSFPFYLKNESRFPLVLYQKYSSPMFRTCYKLGPGMPQYLPFYWDLPCLFSSRRKIVVSLESTGQVLSNELDITQVGTGVNDDGNKPMRVEISNGTANNAASVIELVMDVVAENLSLYVTFYEKTKVGKKNKSVAATVSKERPSSGLQPGNNRLDSSTSIEIRFPEIGISMVQDTHPTLNHYEIMYCYIYNLVVTYKVTFSFTTFGLLVGWLQCDNQMRTTEENTLLFYPTLLNAPYRTLTKKQDLNKIEKEDLPFIKVGVILKNGSGRNSSKSVTCVPYAGILIQEFTLELDEEYLYELVDFFTPSSRVSLIATHYQSYFKTNDGANRDTVGEALYYFEVFQLHPIKVNLTFTRIEELGSATGATGSALSLKSHLSGPVGFIMDVLSISLGNIHDAPLKFNSLLLHHPILPLTLLSTMISEHISQQGLSQLHRFIGSADFLGNPIGLFSCFAEGVSDLFYEPYLGFVSDRPQDFGIGIAKGGVSLLKNTVYGVSDTLTKFTESLSKGLSLTTLDKDFQRQRIQNKRRNTPKHAISGVGLGAKTLITSVASGITGIVTRPIEAVREEGVSGLWKGVGRGMIGVITKPVLGVVDMATQVTQGIRNTTTLLSDQEAFGSGGETSLEKIRLPRVLYYDHVLRPYSPLEAMGQYCLVECARGNILKLFANTILKSKGVSSSNTALKPPVYYMTHLPLSSTEWLIITTAGLVNLNPSDLSSSPTTSASTTTTTSNYMVIPFSHLAKIMKGMDYIRLDISSDSLNYHNTLGAPSFQSPAVFDKKIIMIPEEAQRDWLIHKIELAKAIYKQLYH